jgi:hypothetical protein
MRSHPNAQLTQNNRLRLFQDHRPLAEPAAEAGLIQSVSQALFPGLRAWVEVGGIAPSQCPKAFLPQPISI